MKHHGLFVGIDHYDVRFNRLRYARRDATVLQALFTDNLGRQSTLLLDDQATKENFVTEMRRLAEASTGEDFVMITFSGHGIPGGALAMYDTLPDRLADTSLSLDDFTELTRGIQARALLLVLDCCFSGHAADKVLRVPHDGLTSRDGSVSTSRRLAELRDAGFFVIAASERDQEAFEDPRLRHGVLSHFLIRGLLGDPAAADDGRIYILQLAHYVSRKVSAHKHGLSKRTQEPISSGWTSNFSLEIFKEGECYRATADSRRPEPMSAELASLKQYGIPSSVVDAWQGRVRKLNKLQVDTVNVGALLEGMNVLVSAPTSAGKSLVGEMAAMRAVGEGKKAVFLLPSRALVHEQYERMHRLYRPLGIRTVRATGELRDQLPDLYRGQFELAVFTYEKYIGLLSRRPDLLSVGVLIIDEIQSLMLPERGPSLETMLTWLRMCAGTVETPQIVGLSAVLGEPRELARWLSANLVTSTRREVPLLEGVISPDGLFRYRDDRGNESSEQLLRPGSIAGTDTDDELVTQVVKRLVTEGQQVIVFRSTRSAARTLARRLAGMLGLPAADTSLRALSGGDGGRTTDQLRACLRGGVAFHMADLTTEERQLLEKAFGDQGSDIRVLVATTTLSQGVNLPADSVVVCELEHPSAGNPPYSVSEYKNMAGRAGRAGFKERGHAIVVARGAADADQKWKRYIQAEPEEVRSALPLPATDIRSTILAALAQPGIPVRRRSEADIERFMAATFAAHHSRVRGSIDPFPSAEIRSLVHELVTAGFLARTSDRTDELAGGLTLTDLGSLTVHSGLGVDSVAAVADALAAVPADRINRATLICAAQLTTELDDVRFSQKSLKAHQDRRRLAGRLRESGAAEEVLVRLMGAPSGDGTGIGRARRALACLMWTEGIRLGTIERTISHQVTKTRRENVGPIQQAVQRAADVIATVIDIAFYVHPTADLGDLPDVLRARLELGIVAGLVPVTWHLGVPLGRTVYLSLARAGLTSPAHILAAESALLLDCVGGIPEHRDMVRDAAAAAQAEAAGHDIPEPSSSSSN
jgi:replicative superfamily II helicase